MIKQGGAVRRLRQAGKELGLWSHGYGLKARGRQIFRDTDFAGRTMLEIGCGEGVFSMWAALHGARHVVGLEPMAAGMNPARNPRTKFEELKKRLGLDNVELSPHSLQEYDGPSDYFDIAYSFDSINHLDEPSCALLRESQAARESYLRIFEHLHRMMKPKGRFIVIDVSTRNFFGDRGKVSPFARSIDWSVHQEPEDWIALLGRAGFSVSDVSWMSRAALRYLGVSAVPRTVSYLTDSYFRIELVCQKGG